MESSAAKRIGETNKNSVLNEIRKRGYASADELVRVTNKSQPTVLKWIGALEQEGYLRRNGFGESTGGRPPSLYEFDAAKGYILGLAIEIPYVKATLLDLQGQPVATDEGWKLTPETGTDAVLDDLSERLTHFVNSAGVKKSKLVGGGIAISGFIDQPSGVSLATPRLPGWRDVQVRTYFEERFGVPFFLNHHIDALTLAEFSYGVARGWNDFLFFDVGYGLGVRVVKDANAVTGTFGNAGLIGHTTVVLDGRRCICGNRGCLEEYVSGRALLRLDSAARVRQPSTALDELSELQGLAEQVFSRWRRGLPRENRDVEELIDFLAIGLANAINIFDLPKVVLSGFVTLGGEAVREALLERSVGRLQPIHAKAASLVFSSLARPSAGPIGAALYALRRHLPFIDPLVVSVEGGL